MAAIYSNGGNRWNILGFNFTKRDALSSVYKISMGGPWGIVFARIFFKFEEAVEGVEAVQELFLYPVSQKYYTLLLFGH
jgi:hypothetical protein